MCNESTEGERNDEPKCNLFTKWYSNMIQTDLTCNELDSPTAGNNINTGQGTKQWHGYL